MGTGLRMNYRKSMRGKPARSLNNHIRVISGVRWGWKHSRHLQETAVTRLDRWRQVKTSGVKNKFPVLALGN